MVNELVGDVRRGLVTLETVIVKFVLASATDSKFTLINVAEITKHCDETPDVVKEHVDVLVSIEV